MNTAIAILNIVSAVLQIAALCALVTALVVLRRKRKMQKAQGDQS